MGKDVITVDNISKYYKLYSSSKQRMKEALSITKKEYHKKHYALKDVSFNVKEGECLGIIGENGSGKSTILKILTGVLTQSSGSYSVDGRISALLELGAGFNMEYTGIENIYLNGSVMGFSREEMDKRVDDIVSFADIGEFIYQPVKSYSSGMFVRLAFAVAINVDPDILIIDEALSVGDVFFQLKCFKKFNEFKEKGKTIVLVTHDTSTVIKYCDRAILLDKGKKVDEGSPKDIVDLYKQQISENNVTAIEDDAEVAEENVEIEKTFSYSRGNELIKKHFNINDSYLEYGNKNAEIIDFGIFNKQGEIATYLEKDEECTFYMKVKFNKDIPNPIFAYAIKDVTGLEITGSNTMLEEIEVDKVKKGDVFEIGFTQRMQLQGGPYYLSLGCTGFNNKGQLEIFHRLYDILFLDIQYRKVSTGFFDLNSKVKINKL